MFYFSIFLLTFALSFLLTYAAKQIGYRFGIVSIPRRRDVHQKPIPRIGGTAMFLSFATVSAIAYSILHPDWTFGPGIWFGIDKHLIGIWAASLLIVLSMLIDDVRGLFAWQKLLIQITAVLVVIASGIGIDYLSNPFGNAFDLNSVYIPIMKINGVVYYFSLWSDLLTLVWLVGMMNVINFVDGVDGLAGGVSAISAAIICLLSLQTDISQPSTALLSIILAGSAAGFLFWNFPPARIFMGDSGSMFLGLILGILAIVSGGKLATAFLVLGFPILDGILVAGGRLLRGENPFTTPDKTHLHHRFLNAGFSVRQSILSLYAIAAAFGLVALQLRTLNKIISAFVLLLLMVILIKMLNMRSRTIGNATK